MFKYNTPETRELEYDGRKPGERIFWQVYPCNGVQNNILAPRVKLQLGIHIQSCIYLQIKQNKWQRIPGTLI
jgi:hypothetical protein